MANDVLLTNKIFLNAALPLLKVIATDDPKIAKKFEHIHCIYQVSALDPDAPNGKYATHFTVNNGEWKVCADNKVYKLIKAKRTTLSGISNRPDNVVLFYLL